MRVKITMLLILLTTIVYSQERRGYVGITMGPSFPFGELKRGGNFAGKDLSTGASVKLLQFGFLLTDNFGLSASWMGSAYRFESPRNGNGFTGNDTHGFIGYGALLAGPMFSFKVGNISRIELKAMLGYLSMNLKYDADKSYAYVSNGLGIGFGVNYRRFLAKKWILLLNSEYISSPNQNVTPSDQGFNKISSLNITAGIAFSIK